MKWVAVIAFLLNALFVGGAPCAHATKPSEEAQGADQAHHDHAQHMGVDLSHAVLDLQTETTASGHGQQGHGQGNEHGCASECEGGALCAGCPIVGATILPSHSVAPYHPYAQELFATLATPNKDVMPGPDTPPPRAS